MAQPDEERGLGDLIARVRGDLPVLLRDTVELAKLELRDSATHAALGSAMFGAAGFLALVAFLLLTVAAALGLVAAGLHPAVAFLLVAVLLLVIALVLMLIGRRSVQKVSPPELTRQNLAEITKLVTKDRSGTSLE